MYLSTTMNLNNKIRQWTRERDSLVCVGLDVFPEKIPAHIIKGPDPIFTFNKHIIDATSDLVLAYKPNLAFYEALGMEGWDVLQRTVEYIPDGILKIGDAKRGDIGSTAQKYAKALFDIGFDVVTVNPYLGWDSIEPFVVDEEKGVFILCLTSNASSRDFQYLSVDARPLYQHVAEMAVAWNQQQNCGLVVGATHPEELHSIRQIAPELPFLIPGIGAQGGDLEASVHAGTDSQGEMAVINSSRGILYASTEHDFADAARREASKLRDGINAIRKKQES
jgi:orotidine 5'-phosphate decarboxylase subfamily 2